MNPTAQMAWRTQFILFSALTMSTAIYAVVLFVMNQGQPMTPIADAMVYGFMGLGVSMAIAANVVGQKLLPPLGEVQPGTEITDEPLTEPQRQAVARLQTAKLITWALSESVAIFGLMLGMLSHNLNYFYPLWVVALVSFAINRPRPEQFLGTLAGTT